MRKLGRVGSLLFGINYNDDSEITSTLREERKAIVIEEGWTHQGSGERGAVVRCSRFVYAFASRRRDTRLGRPDKEGRDQDKGMHFRRSGCARRIKSGTSKARRKLTLPGRRDEPRQRNRQGVLDVVPFFRDVYHVMGEP